LEALGINLGYLLVQLFNFAIMFIVINAWVVKPILRLLEKRRLAIAQGLEDARIASEARANAEVEAQGIVRDAQEKATQIIREAQERAISVEKEIKQSVELEISKKHETAISEIEQERNQMLVDLRSQVISLSIAATQKLIGESLGEKVQHALLADFFSGIQKGKIVILDEAPLAGSKAEIISALPLTQKEQEAIRKEVIKRIGAEAEINFKVDPSILGGLIIQIGDQVVDGSIARQLDSMRQSLH
jgi:F-type H+-transporting ATPase subunit b